MTASSLLNSGVLRLAATLAAALMIASGSYYKGLQTASQRGAAELAEWQRQHQAAELAAEREYSAKLETAIAERQKWQDFAQSQSAKLAEAYRAADAAQSRLQQDIAAYIEKGNGNGQNKRSQHDHGCAGGLDADGLRLYGRALGYGEND